MPDKFLEWGLEKNHFKIIPPAQIVSEVSTITLATISLWSNEYLEYVGWLNNPIIDILYSMTSAGVWIARTDTSGRLTEANSGTISSALTVVQNYQKYYIPATLNGPSTSSTPSSNAIRREVIVPVVSNAAGNIDADVSLVAALASYFGIARVKAYWSEDAAGALTPTLVFKDTTGSCQPAQIVGTNGGADYTPQTTLKDIPITGQHDNEAIVLDTTSSGLGNAKTWKFLIEYNYET